MTRAVVPPRAGRHNPPQSHPDIDPRVVPFLRALALVVARQVLNEIQEVNTSERSPDEGRDLRPQIHRRFR
jgi:hypothetical protein